MKPFAVDTSMSRDIITLDEVRSLKPEFENMKNKLEDARQKLEDETLKRIDLQNRILTMQEKLVLNIYSLQERLEERRGS